MSNTVIMQPANVTERESSPQAYARLLPVIRAVDPARVQQVNLDPMVLVPIVLAKLPKLRTLRATLMESLKDFDAAKFDELDDITRALQHAHGLYEEATEQPGDQFKKLVERAEQLRDVLQADAIALVKRGQLHPDSIREVKRNNGHRALILDLQVLCAAMRNAGAAAQARVSEEELATAVELIDGLTDAVGARDLSPESVSEVSLIRRQAFTLFMETYGDIRDGVAYVRRKFGDLEEYAPSPYTNQRPTPVRRTGAPQRTEVPNPSVSTSQASPTAPVAPASAPTQAPDVAAAVASSGPFRRS